MYKKETLYINVVNRHKDNSITTDVFINSGMFTGKAEANVINSDSLTDPFSYDKQDRYIPEVRVIKTEKNKFTFSFPPHSFTQIKAEIKN